MSRAAPIASILGLAGVLAALLVLAIRVDGLRPALQAWAAASAFEQSRAAAERLVDEAAACGHLWLDTRGWLQAANRAQRAGDGDRALELLRRASAEARLALEQARHEARRYARARQADAP